MADKKKSLGKVPHWDLSNVYPDLESKEFKGDITVLGKHLDGIDAFHKTHRIEKNDDGPMQPNSDDVAE
ncbi:MAG: hypothetical protein N2C13_05710, partial [Chloroflexota bacterium]